MDGKMRKTTKKDDLQEDGSQRSVKYEHLVPKPQGCQSTGIIDEKARIVGIGVECTCKYTT